MYWLDGILARHRILNDREKEAGGIYLFESERALNDFVTGPLATQVKSHPALGV
jgi:hypothetical protein